MELLQFAKLALMTLRPRYNRFETKIIIFIIYERLIFLNIFYQYKMSGKIDYNEMIKRQQLTLDKLQERLKEMREEYLTYQRMIEQMKNNIKNKKVEEVQD